MTELYDLLQDYAADSGQAREILIGLVWTYCEADAVGLAMSPGVPTRTLPWAGSLRGKTIAQLASWVREFEPYQATIGMAAVNAGINRFRLQPRASPWSPNRGAKTIWRSSSAFCPKSGASGSSPSGAIPDWTASSPPTGWT